MVGSTIIVVIAVVPVVVGPPVAAMVVAIPVAVEVVVAFASFPVEAPDRVPELTGTPVVVRGRCWRGVGSGGQPESTCGDGSGCGNSNEYFHGISKTLLTGNTCPLFVQNAVNTLLFMQFHA